MTYSQIKSLIANPGEKCFYDRRYGIANEFGLIAIVYADWEGEALDAAVDNGKLSQQLMSPEDYAEYEANGWDDSYCYLGNASDPFWCEYLSVFEI